MFKSMSAMTASIALLAAASGAQAAVTVTGDLPRMADLGFRTRPAEERLAVRSLKPDSAAARASLEAIETARAKRHADHPPIGIICIKIIADGIDTILDDLNLAVKRFPRDEERVRWELQPWIVEAALKRLGKRQLSPDEQREVWSNTRTPQKVVWPEWWTFRG